MGFEQLQSALYSVMHNQNREYTPPKYI